MDAGEVLFVIMLSIGATLAVGFGVAWLLSSRRVRQLEAQPRGTDLSSEFRLAAVERSVEALSGQMDQLSNGQDFLNRLVAKRLEHLPDAPPPSPVITPH